MKPIARKSGSGLVLGMVMLLIISILSIGLFSMANFNGLEAVYVDHSEEAFWAAEEGLERIVQKVAWDEFFRSSPYAVASFVTNGLAGYSASVVGRENDALSEIFTLRSTGTAPRAERTIQMQVRVTPGPVGNDFGDGGDLGTQNDINSPVIIRPGGQLNTGNNSQSAIHDYIIGNAGSIDGDGYYEGQVELPPDYIPPSFDDSAYQAVIAGAVLDGSEPTYTNRNGVATILFHTDPADASVVTIEDGHTLIAPGTIDFGNNHADIGENVKIYAGGSILLPGHSSIGSGSVLFADQNIEFATHGSSENTELTGVVLVSENGDISFASHADFDGLIFADNGSVYMGASANIDGVIIAAEGINKDENGNAPVSGLTMTFKPDLFDLSLFEGAEFNWNGQVIVQKIEGSWKGL